MIIALPIDHENLSGSEVSRVRSAAQGVQQLHDGMFRRRGLTAPEQPRNPTLIAIHEGPLTEDEIERIILAALEVQILQNRFLLRRLSVPPLWDAGVHWQLEPPRQPVDEFAPLTSVMARGNGDCDDLVSWRVAELRENGEPRAKPYLYSRFRRGAVDMHVQTWRGDGRQTPIEDTSRLLGM